ncbi:Uncharacterised protein [Mycobacterium tuberculosis]|nr:Uncharacterised protein [Mycobacterium tuberculosis]CKT33523.1 Uncharacterised protein [Mycobacterium tuberculosis]COV24837.1 Uncharacterised protein [Mycobacterium tuberculosis]
MLIDVLVLVMFVDRHPHPTDFRQDHSTHTALHHQVDTRGRILTDQQLVQLGGHPFGADSGQLRRHLFDRRAHPRRHRESKLRDEPRGAQHPQRIVAKGPRRRRRGV